MIILLYSIKDVYRKQVNCIDQEEDRAFEDDAIVLETAVNHYSNIESKREVVVNHRGKLVLA